MKKKILLLILSAIIILSFTACKGTEKPASGDEPFAVEELEADPFYKEMKEKEKEGKKDEK